MTAQMTQKSCQQQQQQQHNRGCDGCSSCLLQVLLQAGKAPNGSASLLLLLAL
jgi:hypothetical protein